MEFVTKKIKAESLKLGMIILDNKDQKIIIHDIIPMNSKNLILLNCMYDNGVGPIEMILEKNSFVKIVT